MGTRSIIAVPLDNGFRGRYCHWGGYPTAMAATLSKIIRRDGIDKARTVLIEEHTGWSVIDGEGQRDDHNVPGYGKAYTGEPDEWWTHKDADGGCGWAYVLNDTVISILMPTDDETSWEHVGDLPYDREPTEADLTAFECGAGFERCSHYAWVHVPELGPEDRRGMAEYLKALRA